MSTGRSAELTSARMEAGYRQADQAAGDVMLGKYVDALARADNSIKLSPENPWGYYNRAAALHHLGRVDAAANAYREAEAHFKNDPNGHAISLYGRARVLDDAGRCDEAKGAYDEFASFVRPHDPSAAEMAVAYASQCRAAPPEAGAEAPMIAETTDALIAGKYADVVERTPWKTQKDLDPWLDYDAASALVGLGRTDDALAAFARAEKSFGDRDRWGRSVAIWGRARALSLAGRCPEAKKAFEEYGDIVGASDPSAVRMAATFAERCK